MVEMKDIPRWSLIDLSPDGTEDLEKKLAEAEAGVDITSPTFWQTGFDLLRDKLGHLKGICGGL